MHRDLAPNVVFDILKEYSVELLVLANHAQVWYDESLNYVTDNEVGTTIADTAEMLVIALEGIMHMFNEARANASIDMLVQWEKCYQQFCEHDFFVAVKEAMTAIKGGRITLWSKSAMVATGEINFSFRLRNRMITSCEIALSVASEKLDKLRNVNMHDEKVDKSRGILDGRELSLFKRILAIEAGPFQNVTTYVTYRRAWMKIFKSELSHLQSFEPSKKALKSMKIARIAEYFISSPNRSVFY